MPAWLYFPRAGTMCMYQHTWHFVWILVMIPSLQTFTESSLLTVPSLSPLTGDASIACCPETWERMGCLCNKALITLKASRENEWLFQNSLALWWHKNPDTNIPYIWLYWIQFLERACEAKELVKADLWLSVCLFHPQTKPAPTCALWGHKCHIFQDNGDKNVSLPHLCPLHRATPKNLGRKTYKGLPSSKLAICPHQDSVWAILVWGTHMKNIRLDNLSEV